MKFNIPAVNLLLTESVQHQIDQKIKPLKSLGKLEELALQVALIQNKKTEKLSLHNPHVLVFAGDHGIAKHNVSIANSDVTAQMVANFLSGGAAINGFCQTNHCAIKVINAGIKNHLPKVMTDNSKLLDYSVAKGTKDFSTDAAMTQEQLDTCMSAGRIIVCNELASDCEVLAFGEMGIGNTSSAAAIFALLNGLDAEETVGRGTGISDEQFAQKLDLVQKAISRVRDSDCDLNEPLNILQQVGGFEIAQMCFAMLAAAEMQKVIIVDGFIVTAAAMLAIKVAPNIKEYMIFAHCSDENAHARMLHLLKVQPILSLGLRLGEGTGAVLALPILQNAISFYNQMATFESAGIVV